jgi:probable F420-dependent oxidoreductase
MHSPSEQLVALAQHAEQLGFEGVMGPDHLVYWADGVASRYPYTESGQPAWDEEACWSDPWIAAAAMAATTTTLRVGHHVMILPLRDPVTTAKAIATTSAIAGGRVVLAYGTGWMREEFNLVGQDFSGRGRRVDEMLAVMQLLWSGERVTFHGEFYNFENISMRPIPAGPVPIFGAGHADVALRRSAKYDGWIGATPVLLADLQPILDKLQVMRSDLGKSLAGFDVIVALRRRGFAPEALHEAEAAGVTGVMVSPWMIEAVDSPDSLSGKLAAMDLFAERHLG